MRGIKRLLLSTLFALPLTVWGQQYMGMAGLIHVPTADMDTVGMARVGVNLLPKDMIPDEMDCDGEKFNSMSHYLSITPFKWIQVGYGYTLWKLHRNLDPQAKTGFYSKDRYFSVKLQPIAEDRWWPSVALGGNDVRTSSDDGNFGSNFFRNYFVAMSKHIDLSGQTLGAHIVYRHWSKDYNHKWNGLVGGLTFQPSFYRPLRAMVEWDGTHLNAGADCHLFRSLLLQCALYDCRHFTGGLTLCLPLL